MIECPRLLFPFAREIVATAVRNGGFPPLLLDPIDFVALYQQRMAQGSSSRRHRRRRRRSRVGCGSGVSYAATPPAVSAGRYSRQIAASPSVAMNARCAARSSSVSRGASGCGRVRRAADTAPPAPRIALATSARPRLRLARADQLDIDLGQKLGVEQRAVLDPACELSIL